MAAGVDGFALVRDREMDDALVAAIVERGVFVMPKHRHLGAGPAHGTPAPQPEARHELESGREGSHCARPGGTSAR